MIKELLKRCSRALALLLVLLISLSMFPATTVTSTAQTTPGVFHITNPYANVNWRTYGQYRAALHLHTTRSDGAHTMADTIFDLYNKGFDIVAVTDHTTYGPARRDTSHSGDWAGGRYVGAMTVSQRNAIIAGTFGRTEYRNFNFPGNFGPGFHRPAGQGGMIPIPFANEQSYAEHIITLWADFNDREAPRARRTPARVFRRTRDLGGIAFFAHPGRYTTDVYSNPVAPANPAHITRYVDLLRRSPSALGFELFNRLDHYSRVDRLLWDNLLMTMMPRGRFIWGFSADDSHSMNEAGYNWSVLLMPELTERAAHAALRDGAFYMVTRVNRGLTATDPRINYPTLPDGRQTPLWGDTTTLQLLRQPTPSISNITVRGNEITIAGTDTHRIEWVADGQIIHTGGTINVATHWHNINHNYVRAQLVSNTGMALTQPFHIRSSDIPFADVIGQ